MENKIITSDVVIEIVQKLVGHTSWGGETHHDDESVRNIKTITQILIGLLQDLFYQTLGLENRSEWSAKEILNELKYTSICLLDYIPQEFIIDYVKENDLC